MVFRVRDHLLSCPSAKLISGAHITAGYHQPYLYGAPVPRDSLIVRSIFVLFPTTQRCRQINSKLPLDFVRDREPSRRIGILGPRGWCWARGEVLAPRAIEPRRTELREILVERRGRIDLCIPLKSRVGWVAAVTSQSLRLRVAQRLYSWYILWPWLSWPVHVPDRPVTRLLLLRWQQPVHCWVHGLHRRNCTVVQWVGRVVCVECLLCYFLSAASNANVIRGSRFLVSSSKS